MKSHSGFTIFSVTVLLLFSVPGLAQQDESDTRPFHMGFTPFPQAATSESQTETYQRINSFGDIIFHHFDNGVPWDEARRGLPYSEFLRAEYQFRLANSTEFDAVYLAVTPINISRDGMALDRENGEEVALQEPWASAVLRQPFVKKAYLNHCLRMIRTFEPDYFCYAIEANLLARENPEAYQDFVSLARFIYPQLKKRFPDLPVFFSIYLMKPEELKKQEAEIRQILPYTDIIAISIYPFMENPKWANANHLSSDWITQLTELAPDKPVAISETGMIAENLILETIGLKIRGTKLWQRRYLNWVLTQADQRDMRFINWFVSADYDQLWELLKATAPEIFKVWRDTGLWDGDGQARQALALWRNWLLRPHSGVH